ncbi:hypothetical protein M405DRAFT_826157 [Rhizopogon salebrosus TDB-379]|nr:hypothetical protein M405DRAFT_826157 [Rhizopogon salebrosus TDB-379]
MPMTHRWRSEPRYGSILSIVEITSLVSPGLKPQDDKESDQTTSLSVSSSGFI